MCRDASERTQGNGRWCKWRAKSSKCGGLCAHESREEKAMSEGWGMMDPPPIKAS
jgi:hypothetical protein